MGQGFDFRFHFRFPWVYPRLEGNIVATEARAFIDTCRMKAAELKSPPAAEKRANPQPMGTIKMHVTPWVAPRHSSIA
jgi:hypothetical protein